ncbi:hypothetical protein EDD86DRAFT_211972 [Gorgonomyces haynaldii]|nr:hypothetical protein EDD86DRAFT_211972 [Gorgonomyces haynaldii]
MVILFSNYPSFLSGRRSGSCLRRRVVSMSRSSTAYYFPASFIIGVGFYESIHVVGMLIACADKSKSLIYRLCSAAIVSQIINQVTACVGVDYSISPYAAPQSFLGTALLLVAITNQTTMICVNAAALILIYTFFKTERLIFAAWCALCGICILLRLAQLYFSFTTFIPFVNGTYQGLDISVNPAYVPFAALAAIMSIVESFYICMASVVFIRHIIEQLNLPQKEIAKELILKFGGLKFAALIGIRIFAAGAFIRLMTNGSIADNVTSMGNYTGFIHQAWAIFVVAETAFYVTGSLMQKGSDKMKDSDLQTSLSQNRSRAVREIK